MNRQQRRAQARTKQNTEAMIYFDVRPWSTRAEALWGSRPKPGEVRLVVRSPPIPAGLHAVVFDPAPEYEAILTHDFVHIRVDPVSHEPLYFRLRDRAAMETETFRREAEWRRVHT